MALAIQAVEDVEELDVSLTPEYGDRKEISPPFSQGSSSSERPELKLRPQFRVIPRKASTSGATPRENSTHRVLALAALPALCLLVYVMFWTLSLRSDYYKARLQAQIQDIKIERRELDAEKRKLQAPGLIYMRAANELGMHSADREEWVSPAASLQR